MLRQREPALRHGRYRALPQPGTPFVAFARTTDRAEETLVFVANGAPESAHARLFLPLPHLLDAVPLEDLLSGDPRRLMEGGTLEVSLPAHGCALFRPVDDHASGYRFFK